MPPGIRWFAGLLVLGCAAPQAPRSVVGSRPEGETVVEGQQRACELGEGEACMQLAEAGQQIDDDGSLRDPKMVREAWKDGCFSGEVGADAGWSAQVKVQVCFGSASSVPISTKILSGSGNSEIDGITLVTLRRWRAKPRPGLPDGIYFVRAADLRHSPVTMIRGTTAPSDVDHWNLELDRALRPEKGARAGGWLRTSGTQPNPASRPETPRGISRPRSPGRRCTTHRFLRSERPDRS